MIISKIDRNRKRLSYSVNFSASRICISNMQWKTKWLILSIKADYITNRYTCIFKVRSKRQFCFLQSRFNCRTAKWLFYQFCFAENVL